MGGSSGRIVCLLVLNRVTKLIWLRIPVDKHVARSGVVRCISLGQSKCHARGFEGSYVFVFLCQQRFYNYFLAVAITVVVTDMVAPNTLPPISACLCRIARKIGFASEWLAVSQLQLMCSILCSCIHVFVFIINCLLIDLIFIHYFLFL